MTDWIKRAVSEICTGELLPADEIEEIIRRNAPLNSLPTEPQAVQEDCKTCTRCGTENKPDAERCTYCDRDLSDIGLDGRDALPSPSPLDIEKLQKLYEASTQVEFDVSDIGEWKQSFMTGPCYDWCDEGKTVAHENAVQDRKAVEKLWYAIPKLLAEVRELRAANDGILRGGLKGAVELTDKYERRIEHIAAQLTTTRSLLQLAADRLRHLGGDQELRERIVAHLKGA